MTTPRRRQVSLLLQEFGLARASDLESRGVCRPLLRTMLREGMIHSPARGLYCVRGFGSAESRALAVVAKRVPSSVVCLLSAVRMHALDAAEGGRSIGNPLMPTIWIALPPTARTPRLPQVRVRVVRLSGACLREGVQHRPIDGTSIPVFSPAKTVVDCFRFRHRAGIGLPLAVEALREYLRLHPGDAARAELAVHARHARMSRVMEPYLVALEGLPR
ncbi:MAG: transcriptional regulator [Planctomycetota bacterium]|nr:transcriptional regulator [Planctomycetota bacterium]MDA1105105.1 transcriptional regulator [Planctomycetota bacterium]